MNTNSVGKLIKQKREAKKDLSKLLKFSYKKPLFSIFLDHEISGKEAEKITQFLNGIAALEMNVVLLADSNLESFKNSKIKILPYGRTNRKALLEATDMALSFKFSDIEEMLLHGIIPISLSRPEISDYDPNHETGNSFIYKQDNPWYIFAAVVRARETFKFPYDWKHLIRQGLSSVKSKV